MALLLAFAQYFHAFTSPLPPSPSSPFFKKILLWFFNRSGCFSHLLLCLLNTDVPFLYGSAAKSFEQCLHLARWFPSSSLYISKSIQTVDFPEVLEPVVFFVVEVLIFFFAVCFSTFCDFLFPVLSP
ncbi:hypothetical protein HanIR_Chr05g0222131 [Helianthus annuus]|nr:hypothetical protein HanIR_Chr05g0222131 [Helianthus annuus]